MDGRRVWRALQEEREGGDAAEVCLRKEVFGLVEFIAHYGLLIRALQSLRGRFWRGTERSQQRRYMHCSTRGPRVLHLDSLPSTPTASHDLQHRLMATSSTSRALAPESFLTRQHILFALRCLKFLPSPYQAEDSNRYASPFPHPLL